MLDKIPSIAYVGTYNIDTGKPESLTPTTSIVSIKYIGNFYNSFYIISTTGTASIFNTYVPAKCNYNYYNYLQSIIDINNMIMMNSSDVYTLNPISKYINYLFHKLYYLNFNAMISIKNSVYVNDQINISTSSYYLYNIIPFNLLNSVNEIITVSTSLVQEIFNLITNYFPIKNFLASLNNSFFNLYIDINPNINSNDNPNINIAYLCFTDYIYYIYTYILSFNNLSLNNYDIFLYYFTNTSDNIIYSYTKYAFSQVIIENANWANMFIPFNQTYNNVNFSYIMMFVNLKNIILQFYSMINININSSIDELYLLVSLYYNTNKNQDIEALYYLSLYIYLTRNTTFFLRGKTISLNNNDLCLTDALLFFDRNSQLNVANNDENIYTDYNNTAFFNANYDYQYVTNVNYFYGKNNYYNTTYNISYVDNVISDQKSDRIFYTYWSLFVNISYQNLDYFNPFLNIINQNTSIYQTFVTNLLNINVNGKLTYDVFDGYQRYLGIDATRITNIINTPAQYNPTNNSVTNYYYKYIDTSNIDQYNNYTNTNINVANAYISINVNILNLLDTIIQGPKQYSDIAFGNQILDIVLIPNTYKKNADGTIYYYPSMQNPPQFNSNYKINDIGTLFIYPYNDMFCTDPNINKSYLIFTFNFILQDLYNQILTNTSEPQYPIIKQNVNYLCRYHLIMTDTLGCTLNLKIYNVQNIIDINNFNKYYNKEVAIYE